MQRLEESGLRISYRRIPLSRERTPEVTATSDSNACSSRDMACVALVAACALQTVPNACAPRLHLH
jgi:hypothetical protein